MKKVCVIPVILWNSSMNLKWNWEIEEHVVNNCILYTHYDGYFVHYKAIIDLYFDLRSDPYFYIIHAFIQDFVIKRNNLTRHI